MENKRRGEDASRHADFHIGSDRATASLAAVSWDDCWRRVIEACLIEEPARSGAVCDLYRASRWP